MSADPALRKSDSFDLRPSRLFSASFKACVSGAVGTAGATTTSGAGVGAFGVVIGAGGETILMRFSAGLIRCGKRSVSPTVCSRAALSKDRPSSTIRDGPFFLMSFCTSLIGCFSSWRSFLMPRMNSISSGR